MTGGLEGWKLVGWGGFVFVFDRTFDRTFSLFGVVGRVRGIEKSEKDSDWIGFNFC